MIIIRGRLKPSVGTNYEFISVKNRIKHMILKNPNDNFDFVIEENGRRSSKSFGPDNLNSELIGKEIPIIDKDVIAKFNEDGSIEISQPIQESLPRQSSVDQLKKLRKLTKGKDIGDKIIKSPGESNAISKGVESYEDFQKGNRKFIPNWNLKHLKSPFN